MGKFGRGVLVVIGGLILYGWLTFQLWDLLDAQDSDSDELLGLALVWLLPLAALPFVFLGLVVLVTTYRDRAVAALLVIFLVGVGVSALSDDESKVSNADPVVQTPSDNSEDRDEQNKPRRQRKEKSSFAPPSNGAATLKCRDLDQGGDTANDIRVTGLSCEEAASAIVMPVLSQCKGNVVCFFNPRPVGSWECEEREIEIDPAYGAARVHDVTCQTDGARVGFTRF